MALSTFPYISVAIVSQGLGQDAPGAKPVEVKAIPVAA